MVGTSELRCAARLDTDTDRWTREARTVRRLAAGIGKRLDDETLILYDMRELLSLEQRLRDERRGMPSSAMTFREEHRIFSPAPRHSAASEPAASFNATIAVLLAVMIPLAAPVIALLVLAALVR